MKDHLITLAIVIIGVIAANFISSKLGLDTYEVYNN
jgi:hypothetical protein